MEIRDILCLREFYNRIKYHNEPVNMLYAKGEVVSVDDNFGVRITQIIDKKQER